MPFTYDIVLLVKHFILLLLLLNNVTYYALTMLYFHFIGAPPDSSKGVQDPFGTGIDCFIKHYYQLVIHEEQTV